MTRPITEPARFDGRTAAGRRKRRLVAQYAKLLNIDRTSDPLRRDIERAAELEILAEVARDKAFRGLFKVTKQIVGVR